MLEIIVYVVCVMALTAPALPSDWSIIEREPHEHYELVYMKQPIKEFGLVAMPPQCDRSWLTVTVKGAS